MPSGTLRGVWRVDSGRFHGWAVKAERSGQVYRRYFWDRSWGGRPGAHREAKRYRDALDAILPPPGCVQRRNASNRSGVVGVVKMCRRRRGRITWRWEAVWYGPDSHRRSRAFSVNKYGDDRAKALAIAARKKGVREILEERLRAGTWRGQKYG